VAGAPEPVGDPGTLLERLARDADGPVLAGFDFPIGVPRSWAAAAGVDDFVALLPLLGHGEWSSFFEVARVPAEIGLRRPFYPHGPAGVTRRDLTEALGLDWDELLRRCERPATGRPACPLFWTLGGNQVGRAAMAGWREVLVPALERGEVALWPFAGDGLAGPVPVVAETYPAAVARWLRLRGAKTRRADRIENAARLREAATDVGVRLEPALALELDEGFADDDRYDAFVGVLGMVGVLRGELPASPPDDDPAILTVEGWMLGAL
jgi:hypothetical protein